MSSGGALAWLALAALVQLVWGFYPAVLRFLETKSTHTLTPLQISFLINICACPTMVLHSTCEWLYNLGWKHGHATATAASAIYEAAKKPKRRAEAIAARDSEASADSPRQPLLGASDSAQEEAVASGTAQDEESLAPAAPKKASSCKKFGILVGTTTALTLLMVSQIFALQFVAAYISQMVFLLAPLLVSFLALAVLRTPLPPFFWPTLVLMLAGSGMVVGGKAIAASGAAAAAGNDLAGQGGLHMVQVPGGRLGLLMLGASGVANLDDVLGVGLSLLSAFSLAVFMLTIQVASGAVSNTDVLWANYPTQAMLSLSLTLGLEGDKFYILGKMLPWEWAVVVGVSLLVNWLGNLLQQVTIKRIGAPQVAAFLPLRLVGSLIASYIILAEKLDNAWEGAGAGLVLLTLTAYLYVQKKHADQAAIATLLEEVAAEP